MNIRLAVAVGTLGLAACGSAFAQSQQAWNGPFDKNFGGYVGINGGQSHYRTDCSSLFDCDKKDTGWKVYGGGHMNNILGLEAAYTDFGKINVAGGETKAWAGTLDLVAAAPIGDRFSIFAKGGGLYGHTDVSASPSTLFDTGHKSGWGWTYGAGAAFAVTQTVSLRLDWDRYNMDFVGGNKDVDLVSAGVQMRF